MLLEHLEQAFWSRVQQQGPSQARNLQVSLLWAFPYHTICCSLADHEELLLAGPTSRIGSARWNLIYCGEQSDPNGLGGRFKRKYGGELLLKTRRNFLSGWKMQERLKMTSECFSRDVNKQQPRLRCWWSRRMEIMGHMESGTPSKQSSTL